VFSRQIRALRWCEAKCLLAELQARWCCRIKYTLQAQIYILHTCPSYLQSPEPLTHPLHLCYHIASPLTIYSTLLTLVLSNKHSISTTLSLTIVENLICNVMPSGCRNKLSQMLIQSGCRLYKSASGPRTQVFESAHGQQKPCGFGRIGVAWQHNGWIIMWGSGSGRLPCPWASSTSKVPAPSNGIS